jgi:DNA-binding HxlR family transcriptional regulator
MASNSLCPKFEIAFQMLGKRWTGVILRVLSDQPLRFNEMADKIPHISQKMLSDRLKELEEQGIVVREVYPETPVRIVYRLSERGQALCPVLDEVQKWADKWIEKI